MTETSPKSIEHGAEPPARPVRLNLGCGFDRRPGYVNVDFQAHHDPDLLGDVRDLGMLDSGAYEEILAIDVLEHLPRSDTAVALAEWSRLLAPGGRLHVQVPDLLACAARFRDTMDVAEHEMWIHHLWGTQAYTGDFHLAGFTDVLLVDALAAAGFDRIVLQTRDGWMLTADAVKAPADQPRLDVAIGWLAGIYPAEQAGATRWRWTNGSAQILLVNTGDHERTARVRGRLADVHGRPGEVRITSPAGSDVHTLEDLPSFDVVLPLSRHGTRLEFSSSAAPVFVDDDARPLSLRIDDLDVELLDGSASWH